MKRHLPAGLALPGYRDISTRLPLAQAPIANELILPLAQHIGTPSLPLVVVGESVRAGQLIAKAQGFVSANLHAPVDATVSTIEQRPTPHPSGLSGECIVLQPAADARWPAPPASTISRHAVQQYEPAAVARQIRAAGIVGLGGATFPTAVKIKSAVKRRIDTLIINGCECEPWITCDEMLLKERPQQVLNGARLLQHVVKARRCILAIEDETPAVIEQLQRALADDDDIRLQIVAARYPTGSEKQLIQLLTGKQVPSDGLPADIGVALYNAATAAAIFRAVAHDEPLTSRFVTVSGMGIRQPRVLEVMLGTPLATLLEFCGGRSADANGLIMGGVMMGLGLASDAVPVTKGMNSVLVTTPAMMRDEQGEMPCIRCGECARVCPVKLTPQQLLHLIRADNLEQAQRWHLEDCIECGCCNAVCPSHIPLSSYYRYAKGEIRAQGLAHAQAQHAKQRYEFRNQRLERARREREQRLQKKREALKAKQAAT